MYVRQKDSRFRFFFGGILPLPRHNEAYAG